jgi:hypothetical protein
MSSAAVGKAAALSLPESLDRPTVADYLWTLCGSIGDVRSIGLG